MEFRALQYFLAVVQEGNLSRAADLLHVTQPTLSRQMALLEEEVGAQLFIRGKNLVLTDAGMMLKHRAVEIESLVTKMNDDFANGQDISGVISIGSGGLNSSWMLPEAMAGFKKKHPLVQFRLNTNSAPYIKEQLEQGLLDFGILLEPVDISKFDYIRLSKKEKWGLLVRKGHPLAKKEYITKDDLINQPLLISDRQSLQNELEMWLGYKFSNLDIFATYNIITNVAMLVHSGVASAITLEGATDLFDKEKFVFRPLYPELSMSSVLAWKKFQPGFGAVAKFLEYIKSIEY